MKFIFFIVDYSQIFDYMIILGQVSNIEKFEVAFEVTNKEKEVSEKQYAVYPDDEMLTISSFDRHSLSTMHYGLTPFWSTLPDLHHTAAIDAGNGLTESGRIKAHIIQMPAFRKPIRDNRCLIPVDYFILKENGHASLFFLEDRPFAIAAVFDSWKASIKVKELYTGAAVLTLPAQGLFKQAGFTCQPFILPKKFWKMWLKENPLTLVTSLFSFYPDENINGYPVDYEKAHLKERGKSIVMPIGKFYRDNLKDKPAYEKKRSKHHKGNIHNLEDQGKRMWRS